MTQAVLNRKAAAVTGESESTVAQVGSVLWTDVPFERDREPLVVDWDEWEESREVVDPI